MKKTGKPMKNCIVCKKEIYRSGNYMFGKTRRTKNSVTCSDVCSGIYERIYKKVYCKIRQALHQKFENVKKR